MMMVNSVNETIVAVATTANEILVRPHGNEFKWKEKRLAILDKDGNLRINKNVAEEFGIKIVLE